MRRPWVRTPTVRLAAGGPARTMFLIFPRVRSRRCSRVRNGKLSVGDVARRASFQQCSPPCAFALPTGRRSASATLASKICPARGIGGWRASLHGRTQILPQQPANRHATQKAGRCDQGPLGVRASPPAAQRKSISTNLRRGHWTACIDMH